MIRLRFQSGPWAGAEMITAGAQPVRMGTSPHACQIVLRDARVIDCHVSIARHTSGAYVIDCLGPLDILRIGGVAATTFGVGKHFVLYPGDTVRLGDTEILLGDGQPMLRVADGARAGWQVPVGEDSVTIGRASNCTLVLDDPLVSSLHATLASTPSGFVLRDNRSTNGSFVSGRRVDTHVLTDGDIISIGTTNIHFLIDEVARNFVVEPEPGGAAAAGRADVYAHLVFIAGPHSGAIVPIGNQPVILGRRHECTFVVHDPLISGKHLRVAHTGGGFVLTDLGSTNGTRVNKQPVRGDITLRPGDLIQFGDHIVALELVGGQVRSEASLISIQTVIAHGSFESSGHPQFVIDGQIESARVITIGASPSATVRLDSTGQPIEPVHCEIAWERSSSGRGGDFYVIDKSRSGTYLAGKRAVKEKLHTGHVLQIGTHLINIGVRGERCTLERVDAAAAMAAVQVARETAFDLRKAVPDRQNSGFVASQAAYKTVFHLDLPNTSSMVRERKAELRRGAPAWRPSSDILPDRTALYAVAAVGLMSVLVALMVHTQASDAALLNHPLSAAHASPTFAAAAAERGFSSVCRACHELGGGGVSAERCAGCHPAYAGNVRAAHAAGAAAPEVVAHGRVLPNGQCAACHTEHRGTPRVTAAGRPALLNAGESCVMAGCHPNQHDEEFARPGAITIAAGPVPTFDIDQEALHVAHAKLTVDGKPGGVGCTACHASVNDSGVLAASPPGWSCFGCHQGGREQVQMQCLGCHRDEHGGAVDNDWPAAAAHIAPVVTVPSNGGSLLMAGFLAMAVFVPLVGFGLIRWRMAARLRGTMVAELEQYPVETVKRLVHSINVDKCVGCQLCVQACPTNVLELVNHKSVVVNFDACIQCRKCEAACAFDALRMHDADKPPPMIRMPEVDANYMTPVDGMYLIGQAAGTPQIKNAVNLGHAVVGHMLAQGLRPGAGRAAGAQADVVIVGSGPAGLSAALTCVQHKLTYVCLEKQRGTAWTIRNYYHKGKPVMAEPNDVALVAPLPHMDTVREQLLATWDQYVQQHGIEVRCGHDVTDVKRTGAFFTVAIADARGQSLGTVTGARVVLAIGTMGNPRRLECPGDDLEKVRNALVDPDEIQGRNVLVVGGTDSAIEVVLALSGHNRVWMSCRGAKFDRVKPKNLELIHKAIDEGRCIPLFATVVKQVTDSEVLIEHKADKRVERLPNDYIFAMIGGEPPVKWLQAIGVPYIEKPHSWSPPRTDELARQYQQARRR